MNCSRKSLNLYAVTDRRWLKDGERLADAVTAAIDGGTTFVQLREKNLGHDEFLAEAREIGALCRARGVPFVVNDDVSIAIESGADGVHVGQSDMAAGDVRRMIGPDRILGVSAQTVEEAIEAEARGADYLGVGAVFPTGSKDDADAVSRETLAAICAAVKIPVVAIGGITEGNLPTLADTGICGVAVISAIFAQPGIREAAARLSRLCAAFCTPPSPAGARKPARKAAFTALTIAGSDSSGGAGIQADLKTMTMNGVFAMSAVTALTAQNTLGVTGIMEVSPEFLGLQLDAVFTDIPPDAVKIGMVSSSALIAAIAAKLRQYSARNIVLDPVMVATSGARLISEDAVEALERELLPLASVATPNIPEAEVLSGMSIRSEGDMEAAARAIGERFGCAVLCKGGHSLSDANDVLFADGALRWFRGRRIDNPNTHGTGCTLSSAIAANLAKGVPMPDAIAAAKEYISGALAAMLDLGHGRGPMNHAWRLDKI